MDLFVFLGHPPNMDPVFLLVSLLKPTKRGFPQKDAFPVNPQKKVPSKKDTPTWLQLAVFYSYGERQRSVAPKVGSLLGAKGVRLAARGF